MCLKVVSLLVVLFAPLLADGALSANTAELCELLAEVKDKYPDVAAYLKDQTTRGHQDLCSDREQGC